MTHIPLKLFTFNFLMLSIAINIVFFGALLNAFVMIENNGKMPVLAGFTGYATEEHFYYNEFGDVNLSILSDIIKTGNLRSSLGDVFMMIGLAYAFTSSFFTIRRYRRIINGTIVI